MTAVWAILLDVFWFGVAALMVWTVTNFLTRERGPLHLATFIRALFGVMHDANGLPEYDSVDGSVLLTAVTRWPKLDYLLFEVGMMLTCFVCCSMVVSLGVTLLLKSVTATLIFSWQSYLMIAAALSAIAVMLDRHLPEYADEDSE